MTRLLVSVRDTLEAQIALDEGVDLIDVKEPARGSLGAADVATILEIIQHVDGRAPLSAALGELLDPAGLPAAAAGRLRLAKLGLAGCAARSDWSRLWQRAIDELPPGIQPAAVVYADWRAAGAPSPGEVLEQATHLGCAAMLVDTYDKSQGPLTAHFTLGELEQLVGAARDRGLVTALAGSLGWRELAAVLPLAPDYVAVRGCVCAGDRRDRIDPLRVRRLVALVRQVQREHHTRHAGLESV